MVSEQERIWRYGDGKWDNREFDVTSAATTITCYFKDSGTDASNDTTKVYTRYYGFGRGARHINIRPSAIVTITQAMVGGELVTFSDPITVNITGYVKNFGADLDYIVIVTSADATNVKVEAC